LKISFNQCAEDPAASVPRPGFLVALSVAAATITAPSKNINEKTMRRPVEGLVMVVRVTNCRNNNWMQDARRHTRAVIVDSIPRNTNRNVSLTTIALDVLRKTLALYGKEYYSRVAVRETTHT
jgi:hypothetical protein